MTLVLTWWSKEKGQNVHARRQVRSSFWPFWRFPVRTVLLLVQAGPAAQVYT